MQGLHRICTDKIYPSCPLVKNSLECSRINFQSLDSVKLRENPIYRIFASSVLHSNPDIDPWKESLDGHLLAFCVLYTLSAVIKSRERFTTLRYSSVSFQCVNTADVQHLFSAWWFQMHASQGLGVSLWIREHLSHLTANSSLLAFTYWIENPCFNMTHWSCEIMAGKISNNYMITDTKRNIGQKCFQKTTQRIGEYIAN